MSRRRNFQILLAVIAIGMMASVNVQAGDEAVILHSGHLSGSMLVGDQQLTDVTVRAIDIETGVMASVTVTVPIGVDKISYQLSVEGNRKYHITAEAHILDTVYLGEVRPEQEFVHVPIYVNPEDEVQLDFIVEPSSALESISSTPILAVVTSKADVPNTLEADSLIVGFSATALALAPDFTVNAFPAGQTVNPGEATAFFVSLTSIDGFGSEVFLSVSGLPEGATASFNPNSVFPTGTSILTISTDSEMSSGDYTITVWGDDAGSSKSVDLNLKIDHGLIPKIYGTFSGEVTDIDTGEPIEGAKVFIDNDSYAYMYHYRYANGSESRSGHNIEVTTGLDGTYTLSNVPLGANNSPLVKMIGFYAQGYSLTFTDATAVGDTVTPVNMELGHSTVTGTVTDSSTGLPIAGASIYTYSYAYGSYGRVYSRLYATADEDGIYELPNMPLHLDNGSRTYSTFQVSASGYYTKNIPITTSLGITTTQDFSLEVSQINYGVFSGQVTDIETGEPIEGAKVFLDNDSYAYMNHYRYANGSESRSGHNIEVTTEPNGFYTLTGVPIATSNSSLIKMIGFYKEGYSLTFTNATAVGDAVTTVNMELGHSTATGQVTDVSTGLPIAWASIYTYSYAYGINGRVLSQLYATTNVNGIYTIENVPLHLNNGSRTYSTFQVSASGYYTKNIPITVSLGVTTTQDFSLIPHLFDEFKGRVTGVAEGNQGGSPVVGATVGVFSYYYYDQWYRSISTVTTDPPPNSGHFSIANIPLNNNNTPRNWMVVAKADGYARTFTIVTATVEAITKNINIELSYNRLTGIVSDASNGEVIPGASLSAYSNISGSGWYDRCQPGTSTDENGIYFFDDLALSADTGQRSYSVTASAPGYYSQTKTVTIVSGGTTFRDFAPFDTPVGTDVEVNPRDPETGELTPVKVTFEEVIKEGDTTVTIIKGDLYPDGLPGHSAGNSPTWVGIESTAVFAPNIKVCIKFIPEEYTFPQNVRLMHKKDNEWEDITYSVDVEEGVVCGYTTGFSWFVVVEPAPIADTGSDQIIEQESCDGAEVSLDGSGSTAPYSTPGTNDDIVSFDWYEADTLFASGEIIDYTFPLGEHSVILVVTDSSGITDDDMVTIIVRDTVLPVVDAGPSIVVEKEAYEGTEVTLYGSALDNCDAELDYEWSENGVVFGNDATLIHTFNLGLHTLTLKATDSSGNVGTGMVTVEVVDDTTPPVITCPADVVLECPADTSVAANGSATAIDNFDPAPEIAHSDSVSGSCPMIITRTWTATDEFGNTSSSQQVITIVDTTAPVISDLNANYPLVAVGQTVSFIVDVADNCDDTIDLQWNFGDGEISLVPSHSYEIPDIYTVTVTATDDCGNAISDTMIIVVYDPSAGFTSGGGWFVPDSDSFIDGIAVTDTVSKANFGFIVKYKKGADNPDGNLEFQYKAGNIDLKSQDMDWLVVQSDTKVRFKGKATINGEGLYTFKVTAEDNGEPGTGDWFKIEIWLGVLDTENGPPVPKHKAQGNLGGGNIQIHQK